MISSTTADNSLSLSLSSSVHRSWSKIVQVGHLKSHYVCTDFSHGEISGGIQNLVALVCLFLSFFLSFFFLPFFSTVIIIVDQMYLLRRDSFSSSWYFFPSKLSWLQNVDCFRLMFSPVKRGGILMMMMMNILGHCY